MPEYLYQNPETGEVLSIIQGMNDEHKFVDDQGLEWKRIFLNPTMSVDTQEVDPFSEQQFVEKTANMKGTYGDMIDYSKELSQRREEKLGKEDPLRRKVYNDYKKTRGINHVNDRPKSKSIVTDTYRVDF